MKAATTKHLQRVRKVLKSQLHGKNKIWAMNTEALPVIREPAGIIRHGGFLPKSSTLKLCAKWKEGG